MLVFEKEKYREYKSKTFRIPVEIIEQLEALADENNTSMNRIVIQALEYSLAHTEKNASEE